MTRETELRTIQGCIEFLSEKNDTKTAREWLTWLMTHYDLHTRNEVEEMPRQDVVFGCCVFLAVIAFGLFVLVTTGRPV